MFTSTHLNYKSDIIFTGCEIQYTKSLAFLQTDFLCMMPSHVTTGNQEFMDLIVAFVVACYLSS